MQIPVDVFQCPPEDGEQSKDLDAKQHEREHMAGIGQSRCEHYAAGDRRVGRERRGEVPLDAAAVIEAEEVRYEEPRGDRPDAVGCYSLGQGAQDRRETE